MKGLQPRYPMTVRGSAGSFELRLMTAEDEPAVLEMARSLPSRDLVFLPRDIRQPKVLSAWIRQIADGQIVSLLATREGVVVGCSAITCDPHSFSPHVGELRVVLAPAARDQGLGRLLIQESFLVALTLQLEKLTARMTGDQQAAIVLFEDMGFRAEALLRDHVRDDDGKSYDIVVVSMNVLANQAKRDLYGMDDAVHG